mmetsp:Transcript_15726/g.34301  ORF Transcript_15726/g.34301 Transcript_15726/m.34301 type:complete len:221 (-) Transcript_15726:1640-2302(-)
MSILGRLTADTSLSRPSYYFLLFLFSFLLNFFMYANHFSNTLCYHLVAYLIFFKASSFSILISISTNAPIWSSVSPGTVLSSLAISSAVIAASLPAKSIPSSAALCSGVNSLTIASIASMSYPRPSMTYLSTSSRLSMGFLVAPPPIIFSISFLRILSSKSSRSSVFLTLVFSWSTIQSMSSGVSRANGGVISNTFRSASPHCSSWSTHSSFSASSSALS